MLVEHLPGAGARRHRAQRCTCASRAAAKAYWGLPRDEHQELLRMRANDSRVDNNIATSNR